MMDMTVKLLIAAGALMTWAAGVFAFMKLWLFAALLFAGAMGCLAGAYGFKNRKG